MFIHVCFHINNIRAKMFLLKFATIHHYYVIVINIYTTKFIFVDDISLYYIKYVIYRGLHILLVGSSTCLIEDNVSVSFLPVVSTLLVVVTLKHRSSPCFLKCKDCALLEVVIFEFKHNIS